MISNVLRHFLLKLYWSNYPSIVNVNPPLDKIAVNKVVNRTQYENLFVILLLDKEVTTE